ncbi:MAG: 4Fe-4S dicluster domain-containing protein [Candidatus Omnitrophica bacterium]|nr:4Fe-4S dicluster domain-containing protein [Candidatus Omnitrophota bacterium]
MLLKRERLDVDILFVGAGPAGLSCAIRLAQRIRRRNIQPEPVLLVLEKGQEIGNHNLSGVLLDTAPLVELFPDALSHAPLESQVREESVYWLLRRSSFQIPNLLLPPPMRNRGMVIVSISRLCRWLAEKAAEIGVQVLTSAAADQVIIEQNRVAGVTTADAGLDRQGNRKPNFQPGVEIRAKATVFCEGPKGTLSERVIERFGLRDGKPEPMYSIGVKEVIELPDSRMEGRVVHTLGYPLALDTFGGGFLYGMKDKYVSAGLVVGMDWADPRMDPQLELQRWKQHPRLQPLLAGGKVVEFGARMIPEGGYYAVPTPVAPGALLLGDALGLVNVPRLKGVHLAMRSGMLAAELLADGLVNSRMDESLLKFTDLLLRSSVMRELWKSRNWRQSFQNGMIPGMIRTQIQMLFGGRDWQDGIPVAPPIARLKPAAEVPVSPAPVYDGRLILDKRTDVFLSKTQHDENQPAHMIIPNKDICVKCHALYNSPCTHFCPGNVYNWDDATSQVVISHANCLHPRACEPGCPFTNIAWQPPPSGGGPKNRLT